MGRTWVLQHDFVERNTILERVEEAIEAAYHTQITSFYNVLSESILAANGDEAEIAAAQERFRRSLAFAADVRARARAAAGL
jgi:hypothetical protein